MITTLMRMDISILFMRYMITPIAVVIVIRNSFGLIPILLKIKNMDSIITLHMSMPIAGHLAILLSLIVKRATLVHIFMRPAIY